MLRRRIWAKVVFFWVLLVVYTVETTVLQTIYEPGEIVPNTAITMAAGSAFLFSLMLQSTWQPVMLSVWGTACLVVMCSCTAVIGNRGDGASAPHDLPAMYLAAVTTLGRAFSGTGVTAATAPALLLVPVLFVVVMLFSPNRFYDGPQASATRIDLTFFVRYTLNDAAVLLQISVISIWTVLQNEWAWRKHIKLIADLEAEEARSGTVLKLLLPEALVRQVGMRALRPNSAGTFCRGVGRAGRFQRFQPPPKKCFFANTAAVNGRRRGPICGSL